MSAQVSTVASSNAILILASLFVPSRAVFMGPDR